MSAAPQRIRLSRAKGWRLPPNTVVVSRPGKWGNPFVVGRDGTRLQCVAKYHSLATGFICLHGPVEVDDQLRLWRQVQKAKAQLAGRNLACWCPLDAPCHADLLLLYANPGLAIPAYLTGEIDLGRVRLGMDARSLIKLQRKAARKASADAADSGVRVEA